MGIHNLLLVQAALVIQGLGVRVFEYLRSRKWIKAVDNEGKIIELNIEPQFWYSRGVISQESNTINKHGKPVKNCSSGLNLSTSL